MRTTPPVRKRPRKSPARRAFGLFGWVVWCGMFLVAGSLAGWLGKSKTVSKNLPQIIANLNKPPEDVFGKPEMTVLLLGCDEVLTPGGKQVVNNAARADMILLAKLDFAKKTITGISIPRDTRCKLPGENSHKINAYHAIAKPGEGPALTKRAVEHLLNDEVKIDRVVVLDYSAFTEFVDLIGGVTVSTPIPLKYTDRAGGLYVDIPKGTWNLSGYDAMGFVRIRKNAGDDYARQDRQKQLLVAVKDRVAQNWTMIPEIVDAGAKVLGDSLTPPEITAMAGFARNVPKNSIKMGMLPTKPGRGSFLEVDRRKMERSLEEFNLVDVTDSGVARR